MSNVRQFHSKEEIQEQACLWISRIDRGLTEGELQELKSWCQHHNAHYQTLLNMATYWDNLTVLNELSGLFPLSTTHSPTKQFSPTVAACMLILSILGLNVLLEKSFIPFVPSYKEYKLTHVQAFKTLVGEQSSFVLTDGSHIQLNTNSLVKVNYSPTFRHVELINGEAQFDVKKDVARPFTVTAGEQSFTALGTIFNIQKQDEQNMELVVTEGKVLVTKASEVFDLLKESTVKQHEKLANGLLVKSGEKATIDKTTKQKITKFTLSQLQRDLAWQQGMLIFEGEPLSTVLADISRYTDSQFELVDPELAQLKVAGYFKANDIDGLLASLKNHLNIKSTRSSNNTILLSHQH